MHAEIAEGGYRLSGSDLTIQMYDPNYPDDDTVTMSLSIADPQHTTTVSRSTGETTWCFFHSLYFFVSPPPPPPPKKCFIATATYGSDAVEVFVLRTFRDECLVQNPLGRSPVGFYERVSPPVAALIGNSRVLKATVKKLFVSPAHRVAKRALSRRSTKSCSRTGN